MKKNKKISLVTGFLSAIISFSTLSFTSIVYASTKQEINVDYLTVSAVSNDIYDYIIEIQLNNFKERSIPIKVDEENEITIEYIKNSEYYSDYIYPLAKIMYAEGGNMSDEFQLDVGYVVINRMNSNYYPSTLMGVFLDGDAYAETSRISFWNEKYSDQTLRNAYQVITEYFNETLPCSPAMVYQAQFPQGTNVFRIYNNYFGCDERILAEAN